MVDVEPRVGTRRANLSYHCGGTDTGAGPSPKRVAEMRAEPDRESIVQERDG